MNKNRKAPRRFQRGGKQEEYRLPSERVLDGEAGTLTSEQRTGWNIPSNLRWRNVGDPTSSGRYGSGPLNQKMVRQQNFYDFVLDNPRAAGVVYNDSTALDREFQGEAGNHWRRYMAGPRDKAYQEYYAPGGAKDQINKANRNKSFLHKLFGL